METVTAIGPEAVECSAKLQAVLISSTEDDAFRIVNAVDEGNGIEAYRMLKKRYEPRNAGSKRAVLKAIINNPQCKKVTEMESNLMNLERLFKKYGDMSGGEQLNMDLKVAVMIDLCTKDLREYLELKNENMKDIEVKTEILNYI